MFARKAGWSWLSVVLLAGLPVAAEEWTLKSVLKQVDRQTKEARWVTAEIAWNEFLGSAIDHDGDGKVWIDLAGRMRAEVGGSNPRTLLLSPAYVQLYKPLEQVAEVYETLFQPDLLVQYAMLGFAPRGSKLKQDYDVALVKRDEVDGRNTFLLELTPRSTETAASVPVVMVWIDETTWLPARQLIRQSNGGLQVSVSYRHLTVEPSLPEQTFRADWPAGTTVIGK
ncbi:MAG TPA: hypothetical protein VD788_11460 [Candidatus Polarisedimenticolaceae bacterium]|nr:hypothetical protein [Candidatus Polarisedimenticolaceae bacterium]